MDSDETPSRALSGSRLPRHFHLEAAVRDEPIGIVMHRLLSRYSNRFNERYQRKGHLFQSRFDARLVERSDYLLRLIAYIHRNPVRAAMVARPGDWPWSSHAAFYGGDDPIVDIEALCDMAGLDRGDLVAAYEELLARSEDAVDLGLEEPDRMSLPRLAELAALRGGVDAATLLSGCRERRYTRAKLDFLAAARAHGYSLRDVARALGCSERGLWALKARGISRSQKRS